jgi:antitoxin component YwqK of YwqJK toxin-antitoxin module
MLKKFAILSLIALFIYSCTSEPEKLSEEEQAKVDSLSKISQKRRGDSLKKLNPLLILPPDSEYTGDYIDKYPNGVIKYRGYFRFGERHGQWIAFYNDGLPWSEQHYNKGIKNGENIVYYEGGKIRYKGYYKDDKRDSVWTFYDSLGNTVKSILYKLDKEITVTGK